jgi:O-antigen/teichoic acid export membrane protein
VAADAPDVLDTAAAGGLAIRGGALRIAGFVAGALLTLASAPLLLRHLGREDFGEYFLVTSLIALVGGVTEVGLGAVSLREYTVRTGAARDALMRTVLGARLVLSVAGVALACLFAAAAGYGGALTLGTAIAGAGLLLGVAQATVSVPLATGLRIGLITAGDLLRSALAVALTVALVVAGAGVLGFLAIPVATGAVLLVLTVPFVRGAVPLRPSLARGPLVALLRETVPLAAATMLNVLYARLVIVVMSLVATAGAVGSFGAAYRVVEVAVGIPVALVTVVFPILARAARDDPGRLRHVLQRTLEVALLGGVLLALTTAVGAELIMPLLGGEEFRATAPVLAILAVALVPIFVNVTVQHALLALRRHRELLVANGVALVVIVVLAFALVPPLGAEGGALAVVLGECVLVTASTAGLLRAAPGLRPELRVVPRVALAAALGAAAALVPPLPEVAEIAAAGGVYLGALAALGAIPGELRAAVAARIAAARA